MLGQQTLIGRMLLPAPVVTGKISFSDHGQLLATYRGNPSALTPEQLSLLQQPAIPYNLDAWDGYPVERERLLQACVNTNSNLVVLAGDTHNAWANDLSTSQGVAVGVEFAGPSVSSPGLEADIK